MRSHGNPYLDNLHDLSFADKGHLAEVKDWYVAQLLFGKCQGRHQLTLQ